MASHLKPPASPSNPKTILIADDDAEMRALLRNIIGGSWAVVEVEDGLQALEVIHKQSIDLLITDRTMPGLDGLALLKKLRDEKKAIPTLVISGYGDEETWATAIGLGAEDYLLKPFTPESVLKVIQKKLL